MKVKLQILAKDFEGTFYIDRNNCPITRALARAGYPGLRHTGSNIRDRDGISVNRYGEDLQELSAKVQEMYNSWIPREDFEHVININLPLKPYNELDTTDNSEG